MSKIEKKEFTHFNKSGLPRMVNVGGKNDTKRIAVASGTIKMNKETFALIESGEIKKGDVLATASVGGIMASKQTSSIIPMCHNIPLSHCNIDFKKDKDNSTITVIATTECIGKTGVEMEALTAVSVSLLTIYDMCKAVQRDMIITDIHLVEKSGGKSGHYHFNS